MPELPEVETVMRGLAPYMSDSLIDHVTLNRADLRFPFPDKFIENLQGHAITHLSRRAKYLLLHLNNKKILTVHLGMSGSMQIFENAQDYQHKKHDHVVLRLTSPQYGAIIIAYNDPRRFGFMDIIAADHWQQHKFFAHLAPEPLGNDFHADYLYKALESKKTSIKQALLDQKIVVGVGNIYACEALYQAQISPLQRACDVPRLKIERLVPIIRKVLQAAIESGGSSLRDHIQVDGSLGYFQHHFHVYGRTGQYCGHKKCESKSTPCIQRIAQGGRSTFYCINTQK